MHHLQALRAVAYFAVAEQSRARQQLLGLRPVEVEKSQQQGLPAGIADRHLQLRAIAKTALDRLDHAFDLGPLAHPQVGDRGDPGLVLVAQRQVEPQVLHPLQPEPGQRRDKGRADARQRADRGEARVGADGWSRTGGAGDHDLQA